METYTIYPLETAPRVPFNLDGRILFKSPRYELIHLTLQPGESMEPHAQPMDVVFFVIEGTGSLMVGNETLEIPAKTTVNVPAGLQRAWKNAGKDALKVLVNKFPV